MWLAFRGHFAPSQRPEHAPRVPAAGGGRRIASDLEAQFAMAPRLGGAGEHDMQQVEAVTRRGAGWMGGVARRYQDDHVICYSTIRDPP
jgi:hypothetical protein